MIRAALPARPEARRLLVGTLFWAMGTGMTLPFLYIYLHEVRRIDATVVGLVVAWMGVLSLVLAGPSGALMDRFGARRVLLPLYGVGAVGAVSWSLDHAAWQAFVSGTILALAGSSVFAGQNVILTSVTGEDERQRVFGLSFAVLNLGIGVGGVVAGFIADVHHPTSFQVLYVVNAISWMGPVSVLLSMPRVGRRHPAAEAAGDEAGGYREVFANRAYRRLFVFSLLLFACGYAQIEIGLPAFATTVGHVSTRVIAWAFAVNTMTIVVGQLLVLRRLQGRSRSQALAFSAVVIAVSWAVLGIGGFGTLGGSARAGTGCPGLHDDLRERRDDLLTDVAGVDQRAGARRAARPLQRGGVTGLGGDVGDRPADRRAADRPRARRRLACPDRGRQPRCRGDGAVAARVAHPGPGRPGQFGRRRGSAAARGVHGRNRGSHAGTAAR